MKDYYRITILTEYFQTFIYLFKMFKQIIVFFKKICIQLFEITYIMKIN